MSAPGSGYRQAQAAAQAEGKHDRDRSLDFGVYGELSALARGDVAQASAHALAGLLERGALSSRELTGHYLARIREHDGRLRSVLTLNPDALTDAGALDAERAAGRVRSPLHGLPVLLKDNIAAAGMPTTAGSAALEHFAPDDAELTARLRAAGAVILGKANLSEWANFMSSPSVNGYSVLGGSTRNPHGEFDVGGSSSGSAAAVAADFCAFALGSETWGSLTYPASQNGVVTLKPSAGLLSGRGVVPINADLDTAGPVTRTVADLALVMPALAEGFVAPALDPGALRGARVGLDLCGDEAWREPLLAALAAAGAEVTELTWQTNAADPLPLLFYGIREHLGAYLREHGAPLGSLAEVVDFLQADAEARAPHGTALMQEALNPGSAAPERNAAPLQGEDAYRAALETVRGAARASLERQLGAHGLEAVLSPSNALSKDWAAGGLPALTLPLGLRESGEPLGLTLMGRAGDDARLIALAHALELALPAHGLGRRAPAL